MEECGGICSTPLGVEGGEREDVEGGGAGVLAGGTGEGGVGGDEGVRGEVEGVWVRVEGEVGIHDGWVEGVVVARERWIATLLKPVGNNEG